MALIDNTIDTPALILDRGLLLDNIKTMQDFADQHQKAVRPHAKTHKCTQVAKLQHHMGAVGISVTKPSEAEVMAQAGISGILITSPVVTPLKIDRLMRVCAQSPDTQVVVDHLENVDQLNQAVKNCGIAALSVLVDLDAGIGRTGIAFDQALPLAQAIARSSHLNLVGIQCYAGHIQHLQTQSERQKASTQILLEASHIKKAIEDATGLNNLIQTGSGTGTYAVDCQLDAITEIQPGSYVVMDQEYLSLQSDLPHFQPAMQMITSVISANHPTHVTVDAGLKALYKDPTPPRITYPKGLHYDWDLFGDEHGKVTGENLPACQDALSMIVPHCDPTINLFDQFYIIENNELVDVWPIDLRGKSQ